MTTRTSIPAISESEAGRRLDKYLAVRFKEHSRGYFQRLIESGKVLVNGHPAEKDYTLRAGDRLAVEFEKEPALSAELDASVRFGVVYDGDDFVVIDKPAGLVVHPSRTNKKGTLVNGLLARWPEIRGVGEDPLRPGIVHRLDKETSGLMVVAKNQKAFFWLKNQFKDRKVEKKYIALVYGHVRQKEGEIAISIGRAGARQIAVLRENKGFSGNVYKSRKARTGFKILGFYDDFTLVEAIPYTGRMHQIRVHFKHVGHPVVGDKKYASPKFLKKATLPRQFLHASELSFTALDGKKVEFRSELPADLAEFLKPLKK